MHTNIWTQSDIRSKTPLLAVFAHPDDETVNIGGTLLKASREGIPTYVLCMTLGGKGKDTPERRVADLKHMRRRELTRACKHLGVSKLLLPDFPDGKLFSQIDTVEHAIRNTINTVRPGILITHDPTGSSGHPDHVTVSACCTRIYRKNPYPTTSFYYSMRTPSPSLHGLKPTHKVDILPDLTNKFQVLSLYASQIQKDGNQAKHGTLTSLATEYFHKLGKTAYQFHVHEFRTRFETLLRGVDSTLGI